MYVFLIAKYGYDIIEEYIITNIAKQNYIFCYFNIMHIIDTLFLVYSLLFIQTSCNRLLTTRNIVVGTSSTEGFL